MLMYHHIIVYDKMEYDSYDKAKYHTIEYDTYHTVNYKVVQDNLKLI